MCMRYVWDILLKGLAAVLPIGLTLYLLYWLGISIERVLRPVITTLVPAEYYLPGAGLVAGLVLLFFIGLVVNAWVVQRLFRVGEYILEKIPLVKSIYGGLRDFMDYFSATKERGELKQVVMVTVADMHLIGFLTRERLTDMPGLPDKEHMVAVYLPMSYQIGGYTVYLPHDRVVPLDMSVEDAMRQVLTAGLSKRGGAPGSQRMA
ncbi:hypothetical protein Tel_12720 [Candidatus Tenderia electrophaga]|uniref:DUF502 domain-containing protein n=1 Tax=Candidatus Tenderia electrophaga TaxID=1748243 RepID=A0A0S2TFH8_9GAMM|nr:hypothetical protein Tel_12720 [Candidatus Tenderia electrophaga]